MTAIRLGCTSVVQNCRGIFCAKAQAGWNTSRARSIGSRNAARRAMKKGIDCLRLTRIKKPLPIPVFSRRLFEVYQALSQVTFRKRIAAVLFDESGKRV